MAWTDNLVTMLRVLIDDFDSPQSYADAYLQRVIVCAGILVSQDISLGYNYTFDTELPSIAPDPVTGDDTIAQALIPLKAACLINQGKFQTAIGQGIKVKDGDSSIDTSVSFRGYKDILELGPCHSYERLKWKIQAGRSSASGAVLGPHRTAGGDARGSIRWFYDGFGGNTRGTRS